MKIKKAVILPRAWEPAFCPPPRLSKEMLPIVDKPTISISWRRLWLPDYRYYYCDRKK